MDAVTQPYSAADGLVRVYPAEAPDGTGLVWAHGGGFLFGDIDMPESDWVARQLADRGTTVVSVEYRLAPAPDGFHEGVTAQPGHPYPAGSDDMVTAWRWTLAHATELGISPSALAIGGTSAGGNLAAGAALRLAGTAESPALVLLAYPTLLAVQPAPDAELRAALDANPDADRFGPASVLRMYENYLAGPVDDAPLPAVPGRAMASDLAHFPPTFIVNGDVDELRVSAEHFATTLAAAGREVEILTEHGTQHGHLNRPEEPAATRSIERMARRLAALSPHLSPTPSEGIAS
ncbi:alpha/beta hydrolase [Microbacterium sp.]|uniref:alpha/beta hydrolase n=1 Tax=Microbacterium sp. TaxID=51671 RepID=UPI0027363520|nr:alpha/beta hydrolase fold domain-containing protein [Microbacterium sp.]MDP3952328.1 alpha/beta hydrolase fold domain-containing protein [Microbacterium sp.]